MALQPAKRWFTVDEYYRMAETGILGRDDRVELIEGEVVCMSPSGSKHAACIDRLNFFLQHRLDRPAIIRIQSPLCIDQYSELEPDLTILKYRKDFYDSAHPTAKDAYLVIEVADTSYEHDRNSKLPLFGKAGVPEVWIVKLQENRVEIYSEIESGQYQSQQTFTDEDVFTSRMIPEFQFTPQKIIGSNE